MKTKKTKIKITQLFVWTEFCSDYSDGLAFAIAENEIEARKLVLKARQGFEPYSWGNLTVSPVDHKVAYCVSGGG